MDRHHVEIATHLKVGERERPRRAVDGRGAARRKIALALIVPAKSRLGSA